MAKEAENPTGISFTPEDLPTVDRVPGQGREATKWEEILQPLRSAPGKSHRLWTYGPTFDENDPTKIVSDGQNTASSRKQQVTKRLTEAVPNENWTIAVRAVPGTDPTEYGVYGVYNGNFTPEEVAENARKRAERSKKIRDARAAQAQADEATSTTDSAAKLGKAAGKGNGKPAAA